jgi:hypothetical protein
MSLSVILRCVHVECHYIRVNLQCRHVGVSFCGVIMLNVIMLSVILQCRHIECHYLSVILKCGHDECHQLSVGMSSVSLAKCCHAECHYLSVILQHRHIAVSLAKCPFALLSH